MHHPAIVVTDGPDDLEDALAPFDENLEVAPYRKVLTTVTRAGAQARRICYSYPEITPEQVLAYRSREGATTEFDLGSHDRHVGNAKVKSWNNPDDVAEHLNRIPDEALASIWYRGRPDLRIEGDDLVATSLINPNGKWDWWVVGGRWSGFFRLRSPMPGPASDDRPSRPGSPDSASRGREDREERADQCRWGDVDMPMMRVLAALEAERKYDNFEAATAGLVPPGETPLQLEKRFLAEAGLATDWNGFLEQSLRERRAPADSIALWNEAVGRANLTWSTHLWVRAAPHPPDLRLGDNQLSYWEVGTGGREAYVRRRASEAVTPRVLLVDGRWRTCDEVPGQAEWDEQVRSALDGLDRDAWVTLVDLHC